MIVPVLAILGAAAPSARADYFESFQSWTGTNDDVWEVQDLSGAPYNVPANAVVEIAVRNTWNAASYLGGVRAVGSSLDRRIPIHEAEDGGAEYLILHVQVDDNSQLEHYTEKKARVDFVLLGYWDCASYVETFQSFGAGASATWTDHDLSAYGVTASAVAEIVIANTSATAEREAGVRANGSSLARIIDLHESETGGSAAVDAATMFVAADASSIIEVYAEVDADVDFYVMGYWSVPPGTYTELFRNDLGSPSADATWEDLDLTGFGVPDDAIAEIVLTNQFATEENEMGVRENGSSLARVLDPHEAEEGGWDAGRMHVLSDAGAVIEFYHEDVSDTHAFLLLGYWALELPLFLNDHAAGQEPDAFGNSGAETNAELFGVQMVPCGSSYTVTEIIFTLSGVTALPDGEWADVELVVDADDDGMIDPGETTTVGGAGSVNVSSGTITFSSSFTVTTVTNYILSVDFATLSYGDAVTVDLTAGNITADGPVAGTVSSATHLEGDCYHERAAAWAASSPAIWETKDLSVFPFFVPAGAVVEVAVVNTRVQQTRSGGVRAFGSSLERRLTLDEAEGGGADVMVMHIQADASSRIEHYSQNTSDVTFVLLGYWECGTYVEKFQSFTAGANASWQRVNLDTYGVAAEQVCEIALVNTNAIFSREAGVRAHGSSLSRILDLHEPEGGGIDAATMFTTADGTSSAIIEVYAEVDADVDFHLIGYWSTAPGPYTESFSSIGSPSADATWEDVDLTGFGLPADAIAEITVVNKFATEENQMGVRANGSSLSRLLDLQEAEPDGLDAGRMHVTPDSSAVIEFYHEDVSDTHDFILTGYWKLGRFLYWQFDQCSGGTTPDSSPVGNTGTLEPDESTGPQRTSGGRICGGMTFDATNDDITAGAVSETNAAVDLSVAAWVKPTTLSDLKAVASKFDSAAETGWTMELGDSGSGGNDDVRIAFSSANYAYTTGNILSTAQWAHWAFVYDGAAAALSDRLKFYLNGQAQTLTFAGTIPSTVTDTTHELLVGATDDGASYFDGVIDEVQMYLSALSAAEVLALASEAHYRITDLGTLPSPDDDPNEGVAINDNVQFAIAGYVEDINDDELAWFWKAAAFTDLGTLGGATSNGRGINDTEQVVGTSSISGEDLRAFIWDSSNGMTDLGTFGGRDYIIGAAINAGGQVVGGGYTIGSPAVTRAAFRWVPTVPNGITGNMTDLGTLCGLVAWGMGINDSGQVVGGSIDASGQMHPFLWTSGGTGGVACNLEMEDLGTLGGEDTHIVHRGEAVNTAGKVVGLSYTADGDQHGFLWVSGATGGVPSNPEMKDLGTLGGTFSWAFDINDQDHVVGWSTDGSANYHAFVWLDDLIVDLNDAVDINTTWVLTGADAINDDEYIVGWGTNPSGDTRAFLLTPTRTCCSGGADSTEPPLPPLSEIDSAEQASLADPVSTEAHVEAFEPSAQPFVPLPCAVSVLPLLALIVSALARRSVAGNSR